ncbi:hypothetical protein IID10_22290 [candidate division KSB1 bacterium]|nr:hypothetical protein [candidate division KSB1 bacterium]
MNRKETPDIMDALLGDNKQKAKTVPKLREQKKAKSAPPPSKPQPEPTKPGGKTKATFYISTELLTALENLWLDLRRDQLKYSKGEIVEAGLELAIEDKAQLMARLDQITSN